MTNIWPLVSIVVPSYNHEKYIGKCIESILNQTFTDFELIVIDDGSKDKSREILLQLQQLHKFDLIFQDNKGLSDTLTRGFKEYARGKYVTFCASDDYWLPQKLQKQIDFIESHPEYAMVFGKAYIVDSQNTVQQTATAQANKGLKGGHIFEELILIEFHPPVNYLLKADILKEMNYYNSSIWAEDFDMNLKISSKYPIGYIDEYISCYRQADNLKAKMISFRTVNSHYASISQYSNLPIYPKALLHWHYRCFLYYCRYKETKYFSFKGMLNSLRLIYKKEFIKGIIAWVIHWE